AHDRRGIYNVAGSDLMDRYAFSLAVCREFGLDPRLVKPVLTAELHQKAGRPLKAGLKTDKVRAAVAIPIMGVREGLAAFKKECNG
ncbi:MAG: sugar nucleotide-binding protein, partial [Candidatus Omnitrophica bacterium]|nr:sugar nucleotide-binding protein [Candidatus Omnitrophota bacterium]